MINIDSPDREIIQLSQNKNELRFFEVIREFASRMGWAPSVWIKWFLRMYFKTIDAYPVRIGVSKHSLTLNSDNGLFVAIRDEVRVVKSHGFFVYGWFLPVLTKTDFLSQIYDLQASIGLGFQMATKLNQFSGTFHLVIHPENVFEMVKSGTYNFVQCVFKAPSGLFVDKEGERRSYTCFVSFPTEQLVLEVVYPSLAEKVLSSYRQNIELSLLLNLPTGEESLLFEPSETFKVDVKTEIRDGVAVAVLFARVANPVPGCKYRLSWIEC